MAGKNMRHYLLPGVLGAVLGVLTAIFVACGAEETPTPQPPPTAALAPSPTPALAVPMPTVVPTPTPVAAVKAVYGGILRHGAESPYTAEGLDPAFSDQYESRRVAYMVFDTLVELAPDASFVPGLARSWEISPDGKMVTFHLREGVKFHDGTPLDAEAVKWNYDRYMDPKVGSTRKPRLAIVERVEVAGKYDVAFRLKEPFRPLLGELTGRTGAIVSPTAVQRLNSYADYRGEFGRQPVGAGPFKLKEFKPGSHLIFVRNEDYWDKRKPYLDGVVFQVVIDSTVRLAMLRTGEVDFIDRIRPADALVAKRNPNLKIAELVGGRVVGLKFRVSKPPFDNKALRAAMAYATDRKRFLGSVYNDIGMEAYSATGPAHGVWYDPEKKKVYAFDKQKAREKMVEAGYSAGVSVPLWCTIPSVQCETYQAMYSEVGIKVEIIGIPPGTSYGYLAEGRIDATLMGMNPRADPHVNLDRWYACGGTSTVGFKIGYCNPEYDKLLKEAAAIYDISKAKALYSKAEEILAEDAPDTFVVFETMFAAMNKRVQGFHYMLDVDPRYRDMWLSKE